MDTFKCWNEKLPDEPEQIEAHDIEDAATRFAEVHVLTGVAEMVVCVQDGDRVRRYDVELEWEAHAFVSEAN